jgi:PAS domain S-box-containing protein
LEVAAVSTIEQEVEERFGVLPNFFRLAKDPQISENLWGYARFGYLDNPLPPLFKERLFVWLSRFCETRYCIARHVGFLLGLGHVAGDPNCSAQSLDDVVRLLTRPVPRDAELRDHVAYCTARQQPLENIPAPDTPAESAIFACATRAFVQPAHAPECLAALECALGPKRMEQILLLLAFIHTAHYWTSSHPGLVLEDDIQQLLATHEQLSRAVLEDPEAGCTEVGRRVVVELESLRRQKQQLEHEIDERLQHDLADSRLLHDISNELISEQRIDGLYDKIIDAAVRLMRASGGSMQQLVRAPDGGKGLGFLRARGLTDEAREFWKIVRPHDGTSCGEALVTGQRVVVPDVARCAFMAGTKDLPMLLECGVRAMQTTPLYSRGGQMLGAMSTYWLEPHQPSEHELQMLDILARQTADLIERTQVEESLRASEDRFRRALQPENVGVVCFDTDGRITEANEEFLRMSGYERADLAAGSLRWDQMTPPEWMEESMHAIDEFRTQGRTTPYEKEYIRKDGSRFWALFAATRLSENEGVEFVIDISDRKQTEQALKDTDRRKDVFLAMLAHELRNPLAPISNAVHLLRCANGQRKADRLVEMIDRQVRQMVRLVDDLLEVSRIASGKIELSRAALALDLVVRDAIETSRPLIERAGHTLEVSLPAGPVGLDGDSVRLTQVLSNLLNNAAKYTDPGGHIWLTAHRDSSHVTIAVRDNGIGIAPGQLARIFDLFAQVQEGIGRDQGGLGIGLTMSRSLVEMHGGTIEAHSAGVGLGSEFVVRLPLPQAGQPGRVATEESEAAALAGQRILVVDDNQDAADSLSLLLQADGAEVRVAYDGLAALAAYEGFCPDAALLDLGMPNMDGYELARRLREKPCRAQTRIAALTGWGQDSDRERTRASGFDLHLTKPVDLGMLTDWLTGA